MTELSATELAALKSQLEQHRDELKQRQAVIARDVRHQDEPLEADFAEQAVQRQHDEVLATLDEVSEVELQQIDAALQRMAQGTYGVCIDCGEAIAPQRLHALPFAVRCIDCAEDVR